MQAKHNRKLVFSGIDLVGASMNHSGECFHYVRDELQPLMISSGYLEEAPFLWIGMVLRYGLKHEQKVHFRRIDKKDGELELAREIDMRVFLTTDYFDVPLLKEFFEIVTLDSLIQAGKKYKLKTQLFEDRLAQLGRIPEWEFEMEDDNELIRRRYLATKPMTH